MWRQWRSFYISVRRPHCDTAAALRLLSAMNKLQMAARSPSFILYFQWSWQMVWKDYQHPLAVACASEIDVIISKRMLQWWKIRPKNYYFSFYVSTKIKILGVKLNGGGTNARDPAHTPASFHIYGLLFYVITLYDYLWIRRRPSRRAPRD